MIKNPTFHMDEEGLEADAARMAREPKALPRPVVILGGWHSPGLANWSVEAVVRPATSAKSEDFLSVTYPLSLSIKGAANIAVAAMKDRGLWGKEVDFIGVSMGGIIARALAAGALGHEPTPSRRIFTIATPHRGAKIAKVAIIDSCAWDLRPGSKLLERLNNGLNTERNGDGPELFCYGALRDWWIGAPNTAPPGMHTRWIDVAPGLGRLCSHFAINHDRRVLLDIARRLRGDTPLSGDGTQPPRE
jgi:hypothetical protein